MVFFITINRKYIFPVYGRLSVLNPTCVEALTSFTFIYCIPVLLMLLTTSFGITKTFFLKKIFLTTFLKRDSKTAEAATRGVLWPKACNFIKKEALAQVLFCECCKISKNTFFTEHVWWLLLKIKFWILRILTHLYNGFKTDLT